MLGEILAHVVDEGWVGETRENQFVVDVVPKGIEESVVHSHPVAHSQQLTFPAVEKQHWDRNDATALQTTHAHYQSAFALTDFQSNIPAPTTDEQANPRAKYHVCAIESLNPMARCFISAESYWCLIPVKPRFSILVTLAFGTM